GLRIGLLLEHEQNRGSVLDCAAEAKPDVQWHLAGEARRDVAEIDGDDAEAAALNQQIGSAQRLIDILTAHPKQAIELHAGLAGWSGMEAGSRGNQRAGFAFGRARSEGRKQNTGAAGAWLATDFGHRAARQAADKRIQFGAAGGDQIEDVAIAIVKGRKNTAAKVGLDLRAQSGEGGSRH